MKKEKKKFVDLFIADLSYSESGEYLHKGDVWQFIQSLLKEQEAEIRKMIEKMMVLPPREATIEEDAYNIAFQDVLDKLNK